MTLGNPSTTLLPPFYHPSNLTKTLPSTLLPTRVTLASTSPHQDWTTGTVRIGLVIRKARRADVDHSGPGFEVPRKSQRDAKTDETEGRV